MTIVPKKVSHNSTAYLHDQEMLILLGDVRPHPTQGLKSISAYEEFITRNDLFLAVPTIF